MAKQPTPESLEGRWDILYRDYPEVYDEFARIPKDPEFVGFIMDRFALKEKWILDVGSGTGDSTFKLATQAGFVLGIEIEDAMMSQAVANARTSRVRNVAFLAANAEDLPLADNSVDAALAITLAACDTARAAAEMERVVRSGGLVLRGDVAPGWYGGHLEPIITGQPRDETVPPGSVGDVHARLGYESLDVYMTQDYRTIEKAIRTYGFIHSKRVIDHIRANGVTTIRWKFRIWFKTVS